jgi:hypothetical protein
MSDWIPTKEKTNEAAFSISSRVCTLQDAAGQGILDGTPEYVVPVYQRPYEWGGEHIESFVSSLFQSFTGDGKSSEPEFFGTIQISPGVGENQFEIIDGQQRLTTMLLLLRVLKALFPDDGVLAALKFTWLKTRVNNGKEQEDLDRLLAPDVDVLSIKIGQNKARNLYETNIVFIRELLVKLFARAAEEEGEETEGARASRFVRYVLSGVYFSVLKTDAPLSKTLQIFRAINTAGLPLKENDIFKIRFYEYLHDSLHKSESVFEEIDLLYRKIEDRNAACGREESTMGEILEIYKHILIARSALPQSLYASRTGVFYEQFFDTAAHIKTYDVFKGKTDRVTLSTAEIDRIVDARYRVQKVCHVSAEDACAAYFIRMSRYAKFKILAVIFLFCFENEAESDGEKGALFLRKLSKVYVIYSLRFGKPVKEIKTFTWSLVEIMLRGDFEELMRALDAKILEAKEFQGELKDVLQGDMTINGGVKNIALRLSAMLEEDCGSEDEADVSAMEQKLLSSESDGMYLTDAFDGEGAAIETVWNMWGAENINSLGNMMLVEKAIKAEARNLPFGKKTKVLEKSALRAARALPAIPDWNLNNCKKRKEAEAKKILDYLFS